MPLNPDDPRVKKTRRALRDAFIQLILERGYDAISIQDIATAAETARITFYRHYPDKEALLTDCFNTLYDELVQRTPPFSLEGWQSGYAPVFTLYTHIQEQEQLYRILFSGRGSPIVLERMQHHIATNALAQIQTRLPPEQFLVPPEIMVHHAAGAVLGLAMWWLKQGKPYPAPYMAQLSVWLSFSGIARALGVGHVQLPPPATP